MNRITKFVWMIGAAAVIAAQALQAAPTSGDTVTLMYAGKRISKATGTDEALIFIDLKNAGATRSFNPGDFADLQDANIQNILKVIGAMPHRAPDIEDGGAFLEVNSRLIITIPANRPEVNTPQWRIEEVSLKPLKLSAKP